MEKLTLGRSMRNLLISAVVAVGVMACGQDDAGESASKAASQASSGQAGDGRSSSKATVGALAAYIPADTPYYYTALKQSPDALNDKMWEIFQPVADVAQEQLTGMLAELNQQAELSDEEAFSKILLEELDGKLTRSGFRELGLTMEDLVFYGEGILPMVRVQLADMDALKATIGRIEGKLGDKMPTEQADGKEYYVFGDEEFVAAMYMGNDQLVLGFAPAVAKAPFIGNLTRHEPLSNNVISRAKALDNEYDFSAFALMEINLPQIVNAVLADNSETSTALFSEVRQEVSDVCAAEIREMVGTVPRVISAYTDMSASSIEQKVIFELRSDLATALSQITVPMKGMGEVDDGGLFSMGLAMDINNTKQFMLDRIQAIKADPYECEEFAEINAGLDQAEQQLSQPLPPFVGNVQGFRMSLKDIDLSAGIPTNVKATAMLGVSSPELLLATAQAFVPQLGGLNLTSDGTPVAFPEGVIPPLVDAPHIAMMDHGFAMSVGAGEESGLTNFLDGDAPSGPAPFMTFSYDSSFLLDFQKQGIQQAMAEGADGDVPEAFLPLYEAYLDAAARFSPASGAILFTENGIEMNSKTSLK